jgi:hypothetical protein
VLHLKAIDLGLAIRKAGDPGLRSPQQIPEGHEGIRLAAQPLSTFDRIHTLSPAALLSISVVH